MTCGTREGAGERQNRSGFAVCPSLHACMHVRTWPTHSKRVMPAAVAANHMSSGIATNACHAGREGMRMSGRSADAAQVLWGNVCGPDEDVAIEPPSKGPAPLQGRKWWHVHACAWRQRIDRRGAGGQACKGQCNLLPSLQSPSSPSSPRFMRVLAHLNCDKSSVPAERCCVVLLLAVMLLAQCDAPDLLSSQRFDLAEQSEA
jgi:hypothetical protein